jgi:hypothetical protein
MIKENLVPECQKDINRAYGNTSRRASYTFMNLTNKHIGLQRQVSG